MAKFAAMPRDGHRKRVLRLFGYLKHYYRAGIYLDSDPLNLSHVKFEDNDWKDIYPDSEEYISDKVPKPKNKIPLQVTAMVDASHADDLITRRSVTGYVILIGNAFIKWYSKRQNTVETSTYGSELVAMRIAAEGLLELR